ncbi:MAG: hypothetical protein LBU15_00370 [Rickettsiales bacterium]|jgi:hypothetical protein|nr:hypothetical protein [Rickettsiales bacterium]
MLEEYNLEKRKKKDSPGAREGSLERNSREENRENIPRERDRNASGQSSTRENSQRGLNSRGPGDAWVVSKCAAKLNFVCVRPNCQGTTVIRPNVGLL